MLNGAGRSTEHEISMAVLRYLSTIPSGRATISQIKRHLGNFIQLTGPDLEQSLTRLNERVWEQQVRNIVSHRETEGNFIAEGYLSHSPRSLEITESGRRHLENMSYRL